ncbi:MAG: SAM-dependent methyltransferase [Myxococcota bacterium]
MARCLRQRHHQDHFGRQASNKEGWPARSVYKLEEIDQKWHLLGKGSEVLDLGCAPGSWLRYAAAQVGPTGRISELRPKAPYYRFAVSCDGACR